MEEQPPMMPAVDVEIPPGSTWPNTLLLQVLLTPASSRPSSCRTLDTQFPEASQEVARGTFSMPNSIASPTVDATQLRVSNEAQAKRARSRLHSGRYFYKASSVEDYAAEANQVAAFEAEMAAALEDEFHNAQTAQLSPIGIEGPSHQSRTLIS